MAGCYGTSRRREPASSAVFARAAESCPLLFVAARGNLDFVERREVARFGAFDGRMSVDVPRAD